MAEKKFDPALVENRSSEEKFAYMFQFLLDSVVESAKDVMSEEELEQWLMYLAEQDKLPENVPTN